MNLQLAFLPSASLMSEHVLHSSALQRLLAVGQHARIAEPLEALLCQNLGVAKQSDWPIAPLSWLGEGQNPKSAYWLHADPVHFVLQRDYFTLSEPVPMLLSADESEALIASLNQHFESDGLRFQLSQSGRWYLCLNQVPEISTVMPERAVGRDTGKFAPQGAGAEKWNCVLNEIQMLLFNHPVNQEREANHRLPVNSIWLSGGGLLPAKFEINNQAVFSESPLIKGIAQLTSLPGYGLPENVEALLDQPEANVLLVLSSAEDADRQWFLPLLAALRKRRIKRLTLYFAVRDQVLSTQIQPLDLWKFWRESKPVGTYLNG